MRDDEETRLMLSVIHSYRELVKTMVVAGGRPTDAVDLAYTDILSCQDLAPEVRSFLLEWRHEN